MEVVALASLVGLGYIITKLSGGSGQQEEGFQSAVPMGPPTDPLTKAQKGGPVVGAPEELDQMYKNTYGDMYPAQPNPGADGSLLSYKYPPVKVISPTPGPVEAATSQVMMNLGGVEGSPTYVDGTTVVSQLSGQAIESSDFTHNNMVPFFGSRVRQNMKDTQNTGILDNFTGAGSTQIKKREVETMFDTARAPYGNPYGMEDNTDFVQSRINVPRNRAGEKPMEQVRVAPGVGEKFGSTGKGGFQQMEINQTMIDRIPRTNELRTADNPKLTYNGQVVPGQRFITTNADSPGEVRKYRPDKFYIDETGARFFVTNGDLIKETTRPIQVMKHVARPETSVEYTGPAASQGFEQTYTTGSYRSPMAQQYGGAGYRNADMTSYFTEDVGAPEADYGKSSYEVRPNERNLTSERTMGLNLVPADTGQVTLPYTDDARPTRRAEMVGNIRQTGTPVGYAGGAPSVTVWDPADIARTTVKEGTIDWKDRIGIAAPASAPERIMVYDPDDIAKPTQKAQISAKSDYFGAPISVNQDFTSHLSALNMRTNPVKEAVSAGRQPLAGNGQSAVFTGEINQVTRRLDADNVNDRANSVNRVVGLTPDAAEIGQIRYRVPLKLDISKQRNQREVISAVENNPLMQSLFKNAQHDEALLQEMIQAM